MEAHFADDWCTLMIARGFYFSCNINGLLHLLLFRCTLEKMVLVPLVGVKGRVVAGDWGGGVANPPVDPPVAGGSVKGVIWEPTFLGEALPGRRDVLRLHQRFLSIIPLTDGSYSFVQRARRRLMSRHPVNRR